MKTVIYLRVSTDKQDVERQKIEIDKYCDYKGLTIDRSFKETMSGTIKDRPVLKKMMQYIATNQIKVLVISELSRLGRTKEILHTIDKLNEMGTNLISLKENISTINEDGSVNAMTELLTTILAGINSFEIDVLKYRIKGGLLKSALAGNVNGGPYLPYGYKRGSNDKFNPDYKKYAIDDDEARMVNYIYKLYLDGNGTMKIKNRLNAEGYQTRKGVKWSEITVNRILNNKIYIGKKEYKGELIDLPNLQIIDTKTFNEVQRRLRSHYNKKGINVKHHLKIDRRKIICGVCGKTYYAHKRSNGKDNAYKCISRRYGENCGNIAVNIDKLTKSIERVLMDKFPEDIFDNLGTSEINIDISKLLDEINTAKGELKMLQRDENAIVDMKLNNRISDRVYDERFNIIQDSLIATQEEIERLEEDLVELEQLKADTTSLQAITERFQKDGITKEVLNKIVRKITIKQYPKQISKIKNDPTIDVGIQVGYWDYHFLITRYSDIIKHQPDFRKFGV